MTSKKSAKKSSHSIAAHSAETADEMAGTSQRGVYRPPVNEDGIPLRSGRAANGTSAGADDESPRARGSKHEAASESVAADSSERTAE